MLIGFRTHPRIDEIGVGGGAGEVFGIARVKLILGIVAGFQVSDFVRSFPRCQRVAAAFRGVFGFSVKNDPDPEFVEEGQRSEIHTGQMRWAGARPGRTGKENPAPRDAKNKAAQRCRTRTRKRRPRRAPPK